MSLATLSGDSDGAGDVLERVLGVCGMMGVWTLLASLSRESFGFLHGGFSLSEVLSLVTVPAPVVTLAGDLKAARTLSLEPPDVRRGVLIGILNCDKTGLLVVEVLRGAEEGSVVAHCATSSDILCDDSATL